MTDETSDQAGAGAAGPPSDGRLRSAGAATIRQTQSEAASKPPPPPAPPAERPAAAGSAGGARRSEPANERQQQGKRVESDAAASWAQGSRVEGVTRVSSPVTAGDYARTTTDSPANTAVIPVVREEQKTESQAPASAASSTRQATLKMMRVDPWSVTKVVFALTVAMMIVAVVATSILWVVLSIAGVWDQINSSVTTVLSDESSSFDITKYLGFSRIVGLTLMLSAINVIITTAVATIGAYLYNLAAQLVGGIDITLAEED